MTWPGGDVALRERAVMSAHGLDPDALRLPGVRARGARRAIRVRPGELSIEGEGDEVLLRFDLPAGSYATVMIEELFGAVEDASRPSEGVCWPSLAGEHREDRP
jgi:tRNA(Glu) U13 pseudouridine synthase TruD